jgi:hypothetical protein
MGLREAARKYGISKSTLSHHRATCAVRELITATALEKIAEISDLVPLKSVKQLAQRVQIRAQMLGSFIDADIAAGKQPKDNLVREERMQNELAIKTMAIVEARQVPEDSPQLARFIDLFDAIGKGKGESVPVQAVPHPVEAIETTDKLVTLTNLQDGQEATETAPDVESPVKEPSDAGGPARSMPQAHPKTRAGVFQETIDAILKKEQEQDDFDDL